MKNVVRGVVSLGLIASALVGCGTSGVKACSSGPFTTSGINLPAGTFCLVPTGNASCVAPFTEVETCPTDRRIAQCVVPANGTQPANTYWTYDNGATSRENLLAISRGDCGSKSGTFTELGASAGTDAGTTTADAGTTADAATATDAGTTTDAGSVVVGDDAGAGEEDAGE